MARTVIINSDSSLESFYTSIKGYLDAKYHAQGNSFPLYHMSDAEIAEQESLSTFAAHAGGDYTIANNHVYDSQGRDLGHIERLLR